MSRPIKGLMIKDFQLIKTQMKLFISIIIIVGILVSSKVNVSFLTGYLAIWCSFVALSSVNYDEYENGMAYIFTLPVLRKDYIKEKYMFGFLAIALPTILAACLSYAAAMIKGIDTDSMEYLLSASVSLGAGYLLLALEIPLLIKFGQEKSRIISAIFIGLMAGVMGMIRMSSEIQGIGSTEISSNMAGIGEQAPVLLPVLIVIMIIIVIVLLCISYKVSCRFMDKRQF